MVLLRNGSLVRVRIGENYNGMKEKTNAFVERKTEPFFPNADLISVRYYLRNGSLVRVRIGELRR